MNRARLLQILSDLVAFPTIAGRDNRALINYVTEHLERAGFSVHRIPSADGMKEGLLARFGAAGQSGGIVLSAHSDVVPVEGQDWQSAPFEMGRQGSRVTGRGVTDMKGFIACVLAYAETLAAHPPARPVMIALSWDEELGCRGIPEMIDHLIPTLGRPDLCIVGEPTLLRPCIGHKGKASYLAVARGEAGHSAMAPQFRNALHPLIDLGHSLRKIQDEMASRGARDAMLDPAYSTLHIGTLHGGTALNIVPDHAEMRFEIRHLPQDDPSALIGRLGYPDHVTITETGRYPGLDSTPATPEIAWFCECLDDPQPIKVAFGTEAGYFAALGIPTVICGPGTMEDGHQPDESIEIVQLEACFALLQRVFAPADQRAG
ncbi:acetylornithine deacetylase (plasmid) [Thioclava sp. 'Guangxiensis']|uniref:acetylornithine deacetylase n=1 Tax=Thioclava sp. 'Guangxiensis' TaxID=3149044 RepID=UPI0032C4400F